MTSKKFIINLFLLLFGRSSRISLLNFPEELYTKRICIYIYVCVCICVCVLAFFLACVRAFVCVCLNNYVFLFFDLFL